MGRAPARLQRFGVHEIVFHWTLALPYLALGASGVALLVEKNVGREWISRRLLLTLHQGAGVALIALPTVVLAFSPPGPFFKNVRACLHWRLSDLWWLHASALRVLFPRLRLPRAERFNAGQKLNLLHVTFLVPIVAATGVALWVAGSSQLALRTMHAGLAGLSLLLAAGHIYLALVNPSTRKALGGMFHGRVDAEYAAHHHPAWFESMTGEAASRESGESPRLRRAVVVTLTCLFILAVYTGAAVRDGHGWLHQMLRPYIIEPATLVSPGSLHPRHSDESDLARCTACHDPLGTARADRCLKCHEEIAVRQEAGAGYHGNLGRDCSRCHADHRPRIVDLDDDAFQHDLAMFALEGAHRAVECRSCHDLDGDGRRRYLKIAHETCHDCHDDPHRPTFEKTCSHCHQETAWDEPAASFSHDTDTTFALDGAHLRTPCSSCHRASEDDGSLTLAETPDACRDCHEDPHGARKSGRGESPDNDCSACHDSTRTWAAEIFDHDTRTSFPLDVRHRELACSSCHPSTDPLRYRELAAELQSASPLFTCENCHREIDQALRGHIEDEPAEATTKSPHFGEVSCTECHELSPRSFTQRCDACHPADYDELFVNWQARVSTAVIRSSELARQGIWRRKGIHNWQGVVKTLRARNARE